MSDDKQQDDIIEPYSGGQRHSDNHDQSDRMDHDCTMLTKGFCSQHGVQEERRAADRNRITDLQRDFKDYKKSNNGHVANLCTFKNRVLGCSLLGVLVISGGYAFTYTSNISTNARYQGVTHQIENLSDDVNVNTTSVAVLVSQLSTTNERLGEVIQLIRDEQRIFKDR